MEAFFFISGAGLRPRVNWSCYELANQASLIRSPFHRKCRAMITI